MQPQAGEGTGVEARIGFGMERLGRRLNPVGTDGPRLASLLEELRLAGLSPCLEDGLLAGNVATRAPGGGLLVSPSGRRPGELVRTADLVEVVEFDPEAWCARYRSRAPELEPTSDVPLHWAALVEAPVALRWRETPRVSVHGHLAADAEAAETLGTPITTAWTRCSTPADRLAALELFREHPYPAHRVFIRQQHGFLLLAEDCATAAYEIHRLAERARRQGLLTQTSA